MDPADYEITGRPFQYGTGRPLTDEDRAFLKGLLDTYWKPMAMDHGRTGKYPEGTLTHAEVQRLANLILECRLPTSIGSGMFSLPGYSMAVYDSPEPKGMLVEKPEVLFVLMNSHMKWDQEERGVNHQKSWIFFTGFTHSPDNLTLLDYYGIGRPEPRERYDY
jgi:hypothetical protein